jgi:hypothetical protein
VGDDGQGNGEDEKERRDRELIELLNELRVALPGVQVLFAFLLVVPFSNGFPKLTDLQRDVYVTSFLCTALSTILLIAPSVYHRIRFRQHDKERMLHTSNRFAIIGMGFLAAAMSAVVFLISDVFFNLAWVGVITGLTAACFVWFWYGLPLTRREQDQNA